MTKVAPCSMTDDASPVHPFLGLSPFGHNLACCFLLFICLDWPPTSCAFYFSTCPVHLEPPIDFY